MRKLAIFCAFAWLLGAVTPGWSSTETVLHAFRGARFDDGADPVDATNGTDPVAAAARKLGARLIRTRVVEMSHRAGTPHFEAG